MARKAHSTSLMHNVGNFFDRSVEMLKFDGSLANAQPQAFGKGSKFPVTEL